MTWEHCNSSSANSKSVKNESLDPSDMPLSGTWTYSLRFHRTECHWATFESVRWKLKANTTASSKDCFVTSSHFTETASVTGGSLNFPTPLPSAFNSNTLAAWGASGAPQRPCTNGYRVLMWLHAHCVTRWITTNSRHTFKQLIKIFFTTKFRSSLKSNAHHERCATNF
ncbi:hypothetical protein X975_11058, partial [Stegodyphus mimosarum]